MAKAMISEDKSDLSIHDLQEQEIIFSTMREKAEDEINALLAKKNPTKEDETQITGFQKHQRIYATQLQRVRGQLNRKFKQELTNGTDVELKKAREFHDNLLTETKEKIVEATNDKNLDDLSKKRTIDMLKMRMEISTDMLAYIDFEEKQRLYEKVYNDDKGRKKIQKKIDSATSGSELEALKVQLQTDLAKEEEVEKTYQNKDEAGKKEYLLNHNRRMYTMWALRKAINLIDIKEISNPNPEASSSSTQKKTERAQEEKASVPDKVIDPLKRLANIPGNENIVKRVQKKRDALDPELQALGVYAFDAKGNRFSHTDPKTNKIIGISEKQIEANAAKLKLEDLDNKKEDEEASADEGEDYEDDDLERKEKVPPGEFNDEYGKALRRWIEETEAEFEVAKHEKELAEEALKFMLSDTDKAKEQKSLDRANKYISDMEPLINKAKLQIQKPTVNFDVHANVDFAKNVKKETDEDGEAYWLEITKEQEEYNVSMLFDPEVDVWDMEDAESEHDIGSGIFVKLSSDDKKNIIVKAFKDWVETENDEYGWKDDDLRWMFTADIGDGNELLDEEYFCAICRWLFFDQDGAGGLEGIEEELTKERFEELREEIKNVETRLEWAKSIYIKDKTSAPAPDDDDGDLSETEDEDDSDDDHDEGKGKKKEEQIPPRETPTPSASPPDPSSSGPYIPPGGNDPKPPENNNNDDAMKKLKEQHDKEMRWIAEVNYKHDLKTQENMKTLAVTQQNKITQLEDKVKNLQNLNKNEREGITTWAIETFKTINTTLQEESTLRETVESVKGLIDDLNNIGSEGNDKELGLVGMKSVIEGHISRLEGIRNEIKASLEAQLKLDSWVARSGGTDYLAKIVNLERSINYLRGSMVMYQVALERAKKETMSNEKSEEANRQVETFKQEIQAVKEKEEQFVKDIEIKKKDFEGNTMKNAEETTKRFEDAMKKQIEISDEAHRKEVEKWRKELSNDPQQNQRIMDKISDLMANDAEFKAKYEEPFKKQLDKAKREIERVKSLKETEVGYLQQEKDSLEAEKDRLQRDRDAVHEAMNKHKTDSDYNFRVATAMERRLSEVQDPEKVVADLVGMVVDGALQLHYEQNLQMYGRSFSLLATNTQIILARLIKSMNTATQQERAILLTHNTLDKLRSEGYGLGGFSNQRQGYFTGHPIPSRPHNVLDQAHVAHNQQQRLEESQTMTAEERTWREQNAAGLQAQLTEFNRQGRNHPNIFPDSNRN
jgi:hypothetical protein